MWAYAQLELAVVYCLYHLCRLTNCRLENLFQSQQSVSLGRSTAVNVADETTGLSLANGSGDGGGLPRRNLLGDLQSPARISQAQVGSRRDLGMVREFASNVERRFCLALSSFQVI